MPLILGTLQSPMPEKRFLSSAYRSVCIPAVACVKTAHQRQSRDLQAFPPMSLRPGGIPTLPHPAPAALDPVLRSAVQTRFDSALTLGRDAGY